MLTRETIFREVSRERDRQDRLWGGPDHDRAHTAHDWIAYLTKHVGRAVFSPWTPEGFRKQMIVVAALAVAAIEWIDLEPASKIVPPHED